MVLAAKTADYLPPNKLSDSYLTTAALIFPNTCFAL